MSVSLIRAVEINHPGAKPLSTEEQALLEQFRQRLHERVVSVGLTADDVRRIVEGIRSHPAASLEVMRLITEEARQRLPGGRMLTFDWD